MTLYVVSNKRPAPPDDGERPVEADSKPIALANLKSGECLTSDRFSSCVIRGRDSRHTKLKTLVMGLEKEERVVYGCNLTVLKGGTHGSVVSWTHEVRGAGKSTVLIRLVDWLVDVWSDLVAWLAVWSFERPSHFVCVIFLPPPRPLSPPSPSRLSIPL